MVEGCDEQVVGVAVGADTRGHSFQGGVGEVFICGREATERLFIEAGVGQAIYD